MEMDCIRTQATVSALHDSEHVTEETAEAAREHLADCEQCRTFEDDLEALQAIPVPTAPPELIGRVMVDIAALASERSEEQKAAEISGRQPAEPASAEPNESRSTWFTGKARWGAYGALATAAAGVVLVVALSARGPTPQSVPARETVAAGASADNTFSGQEPAQTNPAVPAPTPAPARAPDYLVFKEHVYSPGSLLTDSAVASPTIGTVTTAFNGAGAPRQVTVLRSPLTDGSIVVPGPDGSRIYEPVVRTFTGLEYQLAAGNTIERFGEWPELPARFQVPTSPDGFPTFVISGGDALGVQTYKAKGVPQSQGFAIAPGTRGTDPAASNPNWTWWEPMQTS
jgi:hypothetical protein